MVKDANLIIDVGTHSVRVAVVAGSDILFCQQQPLGLLRCSATEIEQDASDIFEQLKRCLSDPRLSQFHLSRAALVCQRSTVLAWHKDTLAVLSPALSWMDTRANSFCQKINQQQKIELRQRTGLQLSAHYGASKIAWLQQSRRHNGDVKYGPLAAWLSAKLLADNRGVVCDESNAARTLLWNKTTRCWDDYLCALFTVDIQQLPPVAPSLHNFGDIDPNLIHQQRVPLVLVCGDQNAAFAAVCRDLNVDTLTPASGAIDQQAILLNLGTGAFLLRSLAVGESAHPNLLSTMVLSTQQHMLEAEEACINGASASISYFLQVQTAALGEQEFFSLLESCVLHDELNYLCLNKVGGLASPWWLVDASEPLTFVAHNGDSIAATVVDQARALIESIVFLLCENLQLMPEDKTIYVSGGLSRCDYLLQCLASLQCRPVRRLHQYELSLIGASCMLDRAVELPSVLINAERCLALDSRYQAWRAMMPHYMEIQTMEIQR